MNKEKRKINLKEKKGMSFTCQCIFITCLIHEYSIYNIYRFFREGVEIYPCLLYTEPRKGHFFSNIYQKRNRNKKNSKGNQNNTITFKPLLIFPFHYTPEKKLKQEYWKGNQNKNYLVLST